MMAEMAGRVVNVAFAKFTGNLESVRVENQHGEIIVIKPDTWLDDEAFKDALGKPVRVRVVLTVEP